MSSFNQVLILGNVGSINVRVINNETKVCNLSVATSQKGYTRRNGEKVEEHTEWHSVVLWRGLAEVCEKYVKKGTPVFITGELRTRKWVDKEGMTHYVTEVMARDFRLVGKGENGADIAFKTPTTATAITPIDKEEHQLPFEGTSTDNELPF